MRIGRLNINKRSQPQVDILAVTFVTFSGNEELIMKGEELK